MKLLKYVLTISSIGCIIPFSSKANDAQTAALYWAGGNAANYVGAQAGKYTINYFNLTGDYSAPIKLDTKYTVNAILREFLGNTLKWFPDALRNDVPQAARTAENSPNLNSIAWDAGRNWLTFYEGFGMIGNAWRMWKDLHNDKSDDTTQLEAALKDAQLLGMAAAYFAVANRVASVAVLLGSATNKALQSKTPGWTQKINDKDIHITSIDPFNRIAEATATTVFGQFAKIYMVYWLQQARVALNLYDEKHDAFLEQMYRTGDKALWSYFGAKAQISALQAYSNSKPKTD